MKDWQAARALMLREGYRPRGGEQHATLLEFLRERSEKLFTNEIHLFDQMRRKRHQVIYEVAGLVSKQEAEQVVAFARDFVGKLTEAINRQSNLGI